MLPIKNYYYLLLPLSVFINLLIAWSGNDYISPDSIDYINIAKKLPRIENSLFPIFYPLILKIVSLITNNFLLSYKLINITSIIFCFIYTYKYNFFWKEIWLILTFSSIQSIYIYAWSENIILPLLIIYLHLIYLFERNEIKLKSFLIKTSIVLILLFLTKYNSLFFAIASGLYCLILIKNNKKYLFQIIIYFVLLVFSIFYFLLNYHLTGYFSGNRAELDTMKLEFSKYLNSSKYHISPTLQPFGYSIIKSKLFILENIWQLPYLFSIFLFLVFFIYVGYSKSVKKMIISRYFLFLVINSIIFLILTIISGYYTRIDLLGPRLLLGFSFPLLLALFEFVKVNSIIINYNKLLIIIFFASIIHLFVSYKYGFI